MPALRSGTKREAVGDATAARERIEEPNKSAKKTKPIEETAYMDRCEGIFTLAQFQAAYPDHTDKQWRRFKKLVSLRQHGKYKKWKAYTARFDKLCLQANVMDRRVIQSYYNGLDHGRTGLKKFEFVPIEHESHHEAYYRLKARAAVSYYFGHLVRNHRLQDGIYTAREAHKCTACGHKDESDENYNGCMEYLKEQERNLNKKTLYWTKELDKAAERVGVHVTTSHHMRLFTAYTP